MVRSDARLVMLPALACAAVIAAGMLGTRPAWAGQSKAVSSGVFTKAQAEKGESLYLDQCSACHGPTLRGVGEFGGPGLLGDRFIERWKGMPIFKLYDLTKSTMPQDNPSSLTAEETAQIIAHILDANGYPAGERELPHTADELNAVELDDPPAAK